MRGYRYLPVFTLWLVALSFSLMFGGPGFSQGQATEPSTTQPTTEPSATQPVPSGSGSAAPGASIHRTVPVQPGALFPGAFLARHPEVAAGRTLFEEGCSTCHGFDAKGLPGRAPSLHGAGAQAADFYLRTGRMPLPNVGDEPRRSQPAYPDAQIDKLVAYISSLGGPPIPDVDPERGDLARGLQLFNLSCAGCHATTAAGGVVIGAYAPPLDQATPTQVAQAVRIGPYLMPRFSKALISDSDLDSIARYVQLTQKPKDAGGWGIGHIGPVPEGLIAWLLALAVLLGVTRLLGDRTEAAAPAGGAAGAKNQAAGSGGAGGGPPGPEDPEERT